MSHAAGMAAEEEVARLYERAGCQVLARRWRGTEGEIDLILQDGAETVFVEVKRSKTQAQAAARLSARQIQRITTSAAEFLADLPSGSLTPVRFDVGLVYGDGQAEILRGAIGS
ncbi:MAG: YraN family protein [Pseudomonadota bacterium]